MICVTTVAHVLFDKLRRYQKGLWVFSRHTCLCIIIDNGVYHKDSSDVAPDTVFVLDPASDRDSVWGIYQHFTILSDRIAPTCRLGIVASLPGRYKLSMDNNFSCEIEKKVAFHLVLSWS